MTATTRWWAQDKSIDRAVSGVFEGGGAKGVLYAGALRAMVDEGCWFDAVAGASAGAITATLVAAGMTPDQVEQEMDAALATLAKPASWSGVSRLRDGASYLDQDGLLAWLGGVLDRQVQALGGAGDGEVTFAALYALTGIELNVVAADIHRQALVVFNHQLTPNCQVAEAVVASAAIPFAFEHMPLFVPGAAPGVVVDGGVASNFPSFVFTDRSFRRWAGLDDRPETSVVVGFLLEESAKWSEATPAAYREARFAPEFRATVGRRFRRRPPTGGTSPVRRVMAAMAFPVRLALRPLVLFFFRWFPSFLAWNGRGSLRTQPAWPQSEGMGGRFLRWMDQLLTAIRPYGMFLFAMTAVTLFLVSGLVRFGWVPLTGHVGDIVDREVGVVGAVLGTLVYLGVIAAAVYAWAVLVVLFCAASVAHATGRQVGYGLTKTFLQGPGAPPWAGAADDDHVVRLTVPEWITTLEIRRDEDAALEAALAGAREEARAGLRRALAGEARRNAADSGA